ncbi:MAG: hypothetical protein ACLVJH_19000 [Faecalibacterium prausnitzii]
MPHGLFDYGNVSTAQDLAKIAAACAANQTFAQVAGTASYVLPATNLRKAEHTISSSNSLMNSESANYREYVRWVKGGFTTLAGRCIVAFAEKDGHTYGLVILAAIRRTTSLPSAMICSTGPLPALPTARWWTPRPRSPPWR